MRQPEPRPAVTSFLSALAADLSLPPDEMTGRRHVASAAAAARSATTAGPGRVLRWTAAAVLSTFGLGTGGIALAGGLPAPFQEVAADAARVLPFPIEIPYPADVSRPDHVSPLRPEDGEIEIDIERLDPADGTPVETSTVDRRREGGSVAPTVEPAEDPDAESSSPRTEHASEREGRRADRDLDGDEEDREEWGSDRSHRDDRGEDEEPREERDGDEEEEPHEDRRSDDEEWASDGDSWSDDERHDRD